MLIGRCCAILVLYSVLGSSQLRAGLVIDFVYSGDSQFSSAFADAGSVWLSLLGGYVDGRVVAASSMSSYFSGQQLSTVFVSATVAVNDGVGGSLGTGGPTAFVLDRSGYFLTSNGSIDLDYDDMLVFTANERRNLVLHELAHVLGFGTLWQANGVYAANSGEFTGAHATAAWQLELGQSGTPDVELGGGAGTANAHWNEVNGGGGLTGITDGMGRDMRDELMTGWLNPNSFISNMTVASFRDIGFSTATAVPEPSSISVLAIGAIGTFAWKRHRCGKGKQNAKGIG